MASAVDASAGVVSVGEALEKQLQERDLVRMPRVAHALGVCVVSAAAMDLVDEVAQHGLGDFEVTDDSVFHRTNGADRTGGLAKHVACDQTDSLTVVKDDVGPFTHRHDGRLIEDNPLVSDANQCRTSTEIDTHIHTENAED